MTLTTWRKSSFSENSEGACVEVAWRKSSYSSDSEGNCVEVAWRKSSFSENSEGNCVELAFVPTGVAVRDSKNSGGPVLAVDLAGWRALTAALAR